MLNDKMLWLDLETTGSDEEKGDCIIEIGCVLTTHELEEISSFSSIVQPTALGLGRMMQNQVVRTMHEENGLLAAVMATTDADSVHRVTKDLLAWLQENGVAGGLLVLAGSGVGHFDRRFIRKYMPELNRILRHWVIDVGVIRRSYEMWTGEVPYQVRQNGEAVGKTHRALDDAFVHLNEAQVYRDLWRDMIQP